MKNEEKVVWTERHTLLEGGASGGEKRAWKRPYVITGEALDTETGPHSGSDSSVAS